ncbi:YitT family protein [Ammoniphilus sp. CFH 90114]|uniref:YitT family protein n=1 Tax=Ammoniphilus sp. CFH 90114 TaxID=2493665 RepID=UPI00100DAE7D|nr:YitT family protein [Ammoniphilus sp. CFH 90114]RXT03991.1 YitT family protein [Ammoniphilus sp. CFH 90114]
MEQAVNNRRREKGNSPWLTVVREYVFLIAGSLTVAIAFNLFLNAFNIASGGVSGISIITKDLFGWKPAFTQWGLNALLISLGFVLLGRQFGLKTITGTIILPLFVFLTEGWPTITDEPLLAALYGGVGVGLGLGLVFRGNASTGGTDLVAQIIHKYTGLSLGIAILLVDGLVVVTAALVYGPELALYALISLYITGKTIDVIQVGLGVSKMAFIISENLEPIQEAILYDLDRGVTRIPGQGGFTDKERPVLLCVVSQNEINGLKKLVQETDPDAFIIVTDANEVLGEGFKR